MSCRSCSVLMINGMRCHEIGCPDAWRDAEYNCAWCGSTFEPEVKTQWACSDDCAEAYHA